MRESESILANQVKDLKKGKINVDTYNLKNICEIFYKGLKNVNEFQKKLSRKKLFSLRVYSDNEGSIVL